MLGATFCIVASFFLAFSNGANDNFKGVATLLGSKTCTHQVALVWATFTTLAGSVAAFFLAQELISNFSGKGLVPDDISQMVAFSSSVAIAAGFTVFLATKFGFPISTTHSIVGALVGVGLLASPTGVHFDKLFSTFFLPLILSPFIAIFSTLILYPLLTLSRKRLGIKRESCFCIGNQVLGPAPTNLDSGLFSASLKVECGPTFALRTNISCEERYTGRVLGISAKSVLDSSHFLSSGLVGFARGLNDTPKIAAILLAATSLSSASSIGLVGVFIAFGGIIFSKKIAETMSYHITTMNDGQGFTANLVTSIIVIAASKFGMPVSTTHVSCGSIFGIGLVTKQAHYNSIIKIIISWITTLPVAALLGVISYSIIQFIL